MFRNMIRFYGEELLAPRPSPKLEDHPLSAVRDCLFNIFAATLHIAGRSFTRNWRTLRAVLIGTHLSRPFIIIIIFIIITFQNFISFTVLLGCCLSSTVHCTLLVPSCSRMQCQNPFSKLFMENLLGFILQNSHSNNWSNRV